MLFTLCFILDVRKWVMNHTERSSDDELSMETSSWSTEGGIGASAPHSAHHKPPQVVVSSI